MTPRPLAMLLPLMLAACAGQPHRGSPAPDGSTASPGIASTDTGIPTCDQYLASYRACHRAAGIFPPDQIDTHYREMRSSLLHDSRDPRTRPQLAARCEVLARTLRQALLGRSCQTVPVQPAAAAHRNDGAGPS